MEKIVVLNSGGFDSVCLLNYLSNIYNSKEVYTLFFDYKQQALAGEESCARKACDKFRFSFTKLTLPTFDWSSSGLLNPSDDYYLEMRNLVFLSYALSYAQSIGASKIFLALTSPFTYPDASFEFIDKFNLISKQVGVEVEAPFHKMTKEQIFWNIATKNGVKKSDFFSCLMNDEAQGHVCSNCECLNSLYEEYEKSADKVNDLFYSSDIKGALETAKKVPITKAKIFINDVCNMHCPYCITDNHKALTHPSPEVNAHYIRLLYQMGVRDFDLMGKEPFIDDTIFKVLASLTDLEDCTFRCITNGKNVSLYLNQIVGSPLNSITFSSDGNVFRELVPDMEDNIKYLINKGKDVSISFDVHAKNLDSLPEQIIHFQELGVNSVYVKPIIRTPAHSDDFSDYVSDREYAMGLLSVIENIKIALDKVVLDVPHTFPLCTGIFRKLDFFNCFDLDVFCHSGVNTVFVNSSGFVYGCGDQAYLNPDSKLIHLDTIKSPEDLKKAVFSYSFTRDCVPC